MGNSIALYFIWLFKSKPTIISVIFIGYENIICVIIIYSSRSIKRVTADNLYRQHLDFLLFWA